MGSSNGKCRRPNGVLKGKDGCSSLYALCGNKPSSVLYSKSLENCSLKLYRVEGDADQDDVVVMLDCGGRVYANGKKVYPFDNSQQSSTEELNVSQIIGELSNGRLPDIFGKGGNLEKHLNPGDYAGALDTLLSIFADTFNQLLVDGLKMQDGMRSLEEEKTNLSLKVLELKREQLHSQKLELEKKKLELRVEELEASLSLQSGIFGKPTNYKSATLSRSCSIGVGDGRYGGCRTGSLRRDGTLPEHPREPKNGRRQPRHRVVARLRELEVEREQITHQSSLLQFQLDALSAQHEVAQSKGKNQTSNLVNGKRPDSPTKSKQHHVGDNVHRSSSANESLEKLSTSSNGSSVSGSPLNSALIHDDPFENGSSVEDYPINESPKKQNGININGLINTHGSSDDTVHGSIHGSYQSGPMVKRSDYGLSNGLSGYESSEDDYTDGSNGRVVGRSRRRSENGYTADSGLRFVTNEQRRGSEDEFTDGSNSQGLSRSRKGSVEDYSDGSNGRFNSRCKKGSDNLETIHAVKKETTLGRSESLKDPRFKTRENSWEKYDTLKKRYEDLKKRRAQRLQQGGVFVAQEDMSSSPALQQRIAQMNSSCVDEVSLARNTPLVDC